MARTGRISIAAVAGVLATVAVAAIAGTQAAEMVFQTRSPALALQIDGENPVALVRDAQVRIAAGGGRADEGVDVLDAARRSIAELPLNAEAFRLYGLVRLANSDLTAMGRQVALSDQLSRRDLGAQLFLIEDAVRRNDVAAALRHYDTAMRVQESSRAILFPILTEAMREPAVRRRFLPYMSASNPWLEPFLRFAMSNAEAPETIAELAMEAGGFPADERFATRDRELLSVLTRAEDYTTALRFFRSVDGVDPAVLTQAGFSEATTDPAVAPFTWQPFMMPGIESLFVASGSGQLELEVRLDSGFPISVARKIFTLAPGSYGFAVPMRAEDAQATDTARWEMVCLTGPERAPLLDEASPLADAFTIEGRFTVPAGCAMQMLTLSIATRLSSDAITMAIESPRLSRN